MKPSPPAGEGAEPGDWLDDLESAACHSRAAYGFAMAQGHLSSLMNFTLLQTVRACCSPSMLVAELLHMTSAHTSRPRLPRDMFLVLHIAMVIRPADRIHFWSHCTYRMPAGMIKVLCSALDAACQ